MMRKCLLLTAVSLLFYISGCAKDPFFYTTLPREKSAPPECYAAPLKDCVKYKDGTLQRYKWRFTFFPDLQHRICRGDRDSQKRFLQGVRDIRGQENDHTQKRLYWFFIERCKSETFCDWIKQIAMNIREDVETRKFFFEALKKNCGTQITEDLFALPDATADKNKILSVKHGGYSTTQLRCADFEHDSDPWTDIFNSRKNGCLDIVDWLERHHDNPEGTRDALERCVLERKIRYQESECLHALAVIDRERALSFIQREKSRLSSVSSSIDPIVRVLLRYPEAGQLEEVLGGFGLIPEGPIPKIEGKLPPLLPVGIMEAYGKLHIFNSTCDSGIFCAHTPLLYQLADLAAPELDNIIFEEKWPALEQIELGTGPHKVSAIFKGHSFNFNVRDNDGSFDKKHYKELTNGVQKALPRPHVINAYVDGDVYHLKIRNLGEWYDLETLIGGLNYIMAMRGSRMRYVTLGPHAGAVLVGPRDGLIRASFDGLIEVVEPFKRLWVEPGFDTRLLDK